MTAATRKKKKNLLALIEKNTPSETDPLPRKKDQGKQQKRKYPK
jgi:hypothetical protein